MCFKLVENSDPLLRWESPRITAEFQMLTKFKQGHAWIQSPPVKKEKVLVMAVTETQRQLIVFNINL